MDVSTLLSTAGLSLSDAAELCGVTERTVRNWRDGKSRVPAAAMDLLRAAADMSGDDAPLSDAEQQGLLRYIERQQIARIEWLESELREEWAALAETRKRMK